MSIGILLITHSTFGEVLIQNVSHILGQRPQNLNSLGVFPEDNLEEVLQLSASLVDLMLKKNNCLQILILTDLFGATPSNITQNLLKKYQHKKNIQLKAISGLNLPMLLKIIFYRNQNENNENQKITLEQLCQKAVEAITDGTKIYN